MSCRSSAFVAVVLLTLPVGAVTPGNGFQESTVVSGLSSPTAIAFLPNGDLLITQKTGELLLFEGTSTTTIAQLPVCTQSEMGLLGVAVHPHFPDDRSVYLYRTIQTADCDSSVGRFNQVVRVPLAVDNTVDLGMLEVLLDGIRSDRGNHNGGGVRIGPLDEKLYVGVGDTGTGDGGRAPGDSTNPYAHDLTALEGKVLRLNLDGSIPDDNPFFGDGGGVREEIFASGFRNIFRIGFDAQSGELWGGDVGEVTIEEINLIVSGGNYGWPRCEGTLPSGCEQAGDIPPVLEIAHGSGGGEAVIGGASPVSGPWSEFYVFGDFGGGSGNILRTRFNSARDGFDGTPETIVTNAGPVDIIFGPDDALYYVSIFGGTVNRVTEVENPQEGFELAKGKAKLSQKTRAWSFKFKGRYCPGFVEYAGDLSDLRIRVDGVEYFDPSTLKTARVKLKTNKRTGGIVKIQIKDATKNTVAIDLKKKRLKLVLKTANGFDPANGVTLEVDLANQRASMTAPATLSGKDNRKATFDPTTGIVGPIDS